MKSLIVFDLDGTLAASKSALDAEMASLLHELLGIVRVAVISGGAWLQFEKQVLSQLPQDDSLRKLSILPTCGTQFFQYAGQWKKLYSEDFTADEKEKIVSSLKKAIATAGFEVEKTWGATIEDRGSQITYSALGQQAPLEEKEKWDADFAKRKKIKAILDTLIPDFSVRIGGSTSIDITKPGIDKAYGIRKLRDILGIPVHEMIYVGDALFVGGNDYPAEQAGVISIPVRDPNETKRVVEAIIACLDPNQQTRTFQVPSAIARGVKMSEFTLRRLGVLMEPEPGNPQEVEGVLNPAAARGPDGALYLFPRLVAKGNYSRIGIARVKFNDAGDPAGVERLGIALEPEADYERRPDGSGGCEDPRVTYVEPLHTYVMSYTAFSPEGPRIALALSDDLFHWTRLGLVTYAHWHGIDLSTVDDKDASLFPVAIPNSSGHRELGMLHRPLFPGTRPEETSCHGEAREVDLDHESIWISYCPPPLKSRELDRLGRFTSHHRLATPVSPWERLKIGCGTPPILTKHG